MTQSDFESIRTLRTICTLRTLGAMAGWSAPNVRAQRNTEDATSPSASKPPSGSKSTAQPRLGAAQPDMT
jgi:hypothetical protein